MRQKGLVFFHLCSPFFWFIPALAGTFHLPYSHFVIFNTLGVVIGIGELLLVGYLLGDNLDTIIWWLSRLDYVPVAMTVLALAIVLWRRFFGGSKARMKYR